MFSYNFLKIQTKVLVNKGYKRFVYVFFSKLDMKFKNFLSKKKYYLVNTKIMLSTALPVTARVNLPKLRIFFLVTFLCNFF